MNSQPGDAPCNEPVRGNCGGLDRRSFLTATGGAVALGIGSKLLYDYLDRPPIVIAKAPNYEVDLVPIVRQGLLELGLNTSWVKGRSVLLKPNLVEPTKTAPHINTHPLVVRAAAEVFRSWGAREVFVAEGQGHVRDTYLVLDQSGLGNVLRQESLPFIDLNHDDVFKTPNLGHYTKLRELYFPETLRRADLIVSLPKLKLHHWAGVTLSMKNLFGVMPGICYGWPKNVLHHAGIEQSILDINATVQPHLAIVDGIVGMEGDGPIMGTPKAAGVLVMGTNLPAVDATAARLMGVNPWNIPYLAVASQRLGPISDDRIEQRGETIASLAQPFRFIDHPLMKRFQGL